MVDGINIKLGERDFIVPPLNFARLRKLRPDLETMTTMAGDAAMTDAQMDACVNIIHTALTRNYPELPREDVEDLVDLGNMPRVMAAITGQSGLVARPGE